MHDRIKEEIKQELAEVRKRRQKIQNHTTKGN